MAYLPNHCAPLVSIIILAFRQPTFLNAALDCLTAQTHPNIEIIIIDDASGEEFIRQYHVPARACLLINDQRTATAAVNRNRALARATGEFIAFLDQDDLWSPEKLAVQVAALQQHPKALLHFTHYQRVDEHGIPLVRQDGIPNLGDDPLAAMLYRNWIHCPSQVMIRRSALATVGMFDEAIRGAADWDMWLRISAAGPMLSDPRPLTQYRHHRAQWSRQGLMVATGAAAVVAKALQWLPDRRPDLLRLGRRRHARWLREIARIQLETGQHSSDTMTLLRRCAKIAPLDPRTYRLMWRAYRGGSTS